MELPNRGERASADTGRREAEESVAIIDGTVTDDEIVDEIIDVEEYVKSGRTPPPRAKAYQIRVDKQKLLFERAKVTGRDILERAGKNPPEKYILRQVLKGGALEKVELDQDVDLARHGIEKFKTMLKTAQDGRP